MNPSSLESRLSGTPRTRFLQELFGNSWHFPIANILLEMLVEGPLAFLLAPDLYIILFAGALQAFALSRWQDRKDPRRLLGNLIGPAVYTAIEMLFEGVAFLQSPNHIAYWFFGLLFGALQTIRPSLQGWQHNLTIIAEYVTRSIILATMYYIFEIRTNPFQTVDVPTFLLDPSHTYVILVTLLLGVNAGLAGVMADQYLNLLRETSQRLKTYSEWLFGRDLLGHVIENPSALQLRRQVRTVLFMDIRGFTHWSEGRQPEEVVNLLNRYYQTAEATLLQHSVIKFKLSADEVMAVFAKVDDGLEAALKLRLQINAYLGRQSLGAGIGLHMGPMVEGLLGSKDIKFYDVIGDTVNVAKRIESVAGAGELLVSETARIALGTTFRAGPKRQVTVKGKREPVVIYPLE